MVVDGIEQKNACIYFYEMKLFQSISKISWMLFDKLINKKGYNLRCLPLMNICTQNNESQQTIRSLHSTVYSDYQLMENLYNCL